MNNMKMNNFNAWGLLLVGICLIVVDVFIPQTTIIWLPALACVFVAIYIFWSIMEE